MYSASIIAYAFVKKGIDSGNPISQMKLQKMVYFSHGLHLALHHRPLIKDAIQAWKFGPVIPEIYREYKLYGSGPIIDFKWAKNPFFPEDNPLKELDYDAIETINSTWAALSDWDAVQLSNWTHLDGSPWQKYYKEGVSDIIIPQAEMEEYFKQYVN